MNFAEKHISFSSDEYFPLGASVVIPRDSGHFPAAVFVQGAGPQDRDESVAMNRPMRDIAFGLAQHGIASIRFDKRTLTHEAKCNAMIRELTVKEEIISDAVAAAEALKAVPGVNPHRIFLLGHGFGGMIAPRIAAENPGLFAGIIILAGSPRRVGEVIRDQNLSQLDDLPDSVRESAKQQIEAMLGMFEAFGTMPDEDVKNIDIGGASGYYIKELDANAGAYYLGKTDLPVLIMHGKDDLQLVFDTEFSLFKSLPIKAATLKEYEGLNHYFMKSIEGTIADYETEGSVSPDAVLDIVNWINEI